MIIKIPYQRDHIPVQIPDSCHIQVVEPNDVQSGCEDEIIKNGLLNPIDSIDLGQFVDQANDLLIIVNDATRPTPTARIIDAIFPVIKDKKVQFIIATGAHRAATEEELKIIIGKHYPSFKNQIISHDARNQEEMQYIGTSKNGTRLLLNKRALEADKIIVIGSVEPHYFAGYTGGRKGFLPGIAAYQSIEQNHKHALDPRARALALKDNPVHEDMIDALKVIDMPVFAIMTVLDKNHNIYAVTSGDINQSFYAAIDKADDVFVAAVEKKADIVISVAKYPMDIDLYQSQKAIENGKLVLNKDGILILVSSCRCGIGDESFFNLLSSCSKPEQVLEKIASEYKLGFHKAGKMAEMSFWSQIWAVSELEETALDKIFIQAKPSLQSAIDQAIDIKGKQAGLLILLDGSITIPKVEKRGDQ